MSASAGAVSILSVGEGHITLSFNAADEAERIRAGRIVTDMLRRGYALLVAIPGENGAVKWARAKEFDEATSEYVIADLDPLAAAAADAAAEAPSSPWTPPAQPKQRRGWTRKRVKAGDVETVAVGRTAGG